MVNEQIIDRITNLFNASKNVAALDVINKHLKDSPDRLFQLTLLVLKSKILRYTFHIDIERRNFITEKFIQEIRSLHNKELEAQALNEYIYTLWSSGNIESAYRLLKEETNLFEHVTNLETKSTYFNLLGVIISAKGDLDLANEYNEKCLKIRLKLNNALLKAQILNNMALTFAFKSQFTLAEQYCDQCLTILRTIDNPFTLANALDTYLEILFLSRKEETIKPLISELENIYTSNPGKIDIEVIYLLNKALALKMINRLQSKLKAAEMLHEIIYSNKFDNVYLYIEKQRAIKHYCEILLLELQTLGNEEIFQEILDVVQKLENMAIVQNSNHVLIETLILKSKLALIEGKLDDVNDILQRALKLSIEDGITQLTSDVKLEINIFENELAKWKNLMETNASMYEKMEQSKIVEYIKQVQEKIL